MKVFLLCLVTSLGHSFTIDKVDTVAVYGSMELCQSAVEMIKDQILPGQRAYMHLECRVTEVIGK